MPQLKSWGLGASPQRVQGRALTVNSWARGTVAQSTRKPLVGAAGGVLDDKWHAVRRPRQLRLTGHVPNGIHISMDSRSALLRAALMLFASRGYDGVGVQEIAAATGVAKPTLYHFFGSKQGLLEALFAEYAGELDREIAEAAIYRGDLPLSLDRIAAAYIGFATREPEGYFLELALYFAPRESPARAVAVHHYVHRQALLEKVFADAARDHGNLRGRHRRYAVSFVGALNSAIALQLDGEMTITDRLRRDIVHQFSHGIYS